MIKNLKNETQTEIVAIGRYNSIRSYAKQNGLTAVSLSDITGQSGIYNSSLIPDGIDVLDSTTSFNGGWCWYKGWCAV